MIPSSYTLKAWKNAVSRESPMATLFSIDVGGATPLRLVQGDPTGTGSVTYGGNSYTAAVIVLGESEQNIDGEIGTFSLAISNINGVAGGYIEANELDGRTVTIIRVPISTIKAGTPGTTDVITEVHTIRDLGYNRKFATVQLGAPNFFVRKVPVRKYLRLGCQHPWEKRFLNDSGCGYPSDEFGDDTTQDFRPGAGLEERICFHGWRVLNAANAEKFDVNVSNLQGMVIDVYVENAEWSGNTQAAPFAFKLLTGDFSVFTQVNLTGSSSQSLAGILCAGNSDLTTWIHLGLTMMVDVVNVRLVSSSSGVMTEDALYATGASHIRLSRVGSVFTASYSTDGETWTTLGASSVGVSTDVRLGLCVSSTATDRGVVGAEFSRFKFVSGGLPNCERTIETCRVRCNTHRIFAFPGIPRN